MAAPAEADADGGPLPATTAGLAAVPPNSEACPVCRCQASHSMNSDIMKTTHSRVRRISVMRLSGSEDGARGLARPAAGAGG